MGILLSALLLLLPMAPFVVASPACAKTIDHVFICAKPKQSAQAWNNKGVDLFAAKKYEQAIQAFDQALKINPNYLEAYSNRGAAYDGLNNPERAIQDYSEAIRLSPKLTQAFINRASAYCDLGKFDKAIEDWTIVIKRTPRDASAYDKRGACYKSLGDLPSALKDFDKAVSLNHHLTDAIKNRDLVKKAMQPADSTPAPVKSVDARAPHDASATAETAEPQISKATEPAAAPAVQQPAEKPPVQPVTPAPNVVAAKPAVAANKPSANPFSYISDVTHQIMGNILYRCGMYDAAAAHYSDAIKVAPQDQFAYFRRGNARAKMGLTSGALTDYEAALEINPRFQQAAQQKSKLNGGAK